MNIQFRESQEAASPLTVKTAIADCDIHPARATAPSSIPTLPNAGSITSKSTASMPIRA